MLPAAGTLGALHSAPSKPTPKRRRNDEGTKSSPYAIESDDEDELQVRISKKRTKPSGVLQDHAQAPTQAPAQAAFQTVEGESFDDMLLITHVQAKKSGVVRNTVPACSPTTFGKLGDGARSSSRAAASSSMSYTPSAAPVRLSRDSGRIVGAFSSPTRAPAPIDTPSPFSPFSQTSFPLYGEQTCLKSTLESVSKKGEPSASSARFKSGVAASSSHGGPAAHTAVEFPSLTSEVNVFSHGGTHLLTFRDKAPVTDCQPGQLEDPFSPPTLSSYGRHAPTSKEPLVIPVNQRPYPSAPTNVFSFGTTGGSSSVPDPFVGPSIPRPSPFTSKYSPRSSLRRRVCTPDRLFTNMSVSNINELILAMPRIEVEEARRRAKKKTRTLASLNGGGAKKAEPTKESGSVKKIGGDANSSVKAAEQHECIEMAEDDDIDSLHVQVQAMSGDDNLDLIDAEAGPEEAEYEGFNGIEICAGAKAGHESDNTLAGSEDELAISPAGTKTKKSQEKRRSSPTVTASVAASTAPSERSEYTKMREAEFMKGFNTKYWLGGFSFRDAVLEVNAGNRLSIVRFNQEEGERRLRSLADQGKLAIRHELVCHLDQDPGPIAPSHQPSKVEPTTATQRIQEQPSTYGRISAARFEVFMFWLINNVQDGHLFNNDRREDTLGNCLTHLNENLDRLGEEEKLSLKEISAAFVHLQKSKDLVLEGEKIRFIEREQSKSSKRR